MPNQSDDHVSCLNFFLNWVIQLNSPMSYIKRFLNIYLKPNEGNNYKKDIVQNCFAASASKFFHA